MFNTKRKEEHRKALIDIAISLKINDTLQASKS